MIVHEFISEGNPLSWYREFQFKLDSPYTIIDITKSEVNRVHFLRSAFMELR